MALVNPNIAMSFRQPEFRPRNALADYAQVQQIIGGQRQAEMAEMQMEELRRERGVLGQIAAAISAKGGPDLQTASLLMMKNPKTSEQGYNIYQALQKQKRLEDYERQYGGDNAAPTASMVAPAAAAAPAPEGELVAAPIRPIPLPVTAPAAADAPAPAGETNLQYLQRQFGTPGGAAPTPAAPNTLAPAAAPTTNAMLASAAGATPDVNALMRRYNLASRAGSPDAPVILKQIEAALRNDQNNPITVSRGQVVIDRRTGQQIFAAPEATTLPDRFVPVGKLVFDRQTQQYISPTQAQLAQTQERATTVAAPSQKPPSGGSATLGLAPKDIQKREAAFPQATQSVKSFVTKSNQFITELERLRDDPGLDQITGPIYGRTPSVSRAGSRAQALYDKIFAKGGFQALQDMREASKTGGALGNVSNEEGRRLEKSVVGGLDRTQNIADVQQGINDLIDEIRTSQARVQEAYDTTYDYRAQRGGGAAAKQMSPQDKQALDWANSNPKDPRAAQIKARLGVQ